MWNVEEKLTLNDIADSLSSHPQSTILKQLNLWGYSYHKLWKTWKFVLVEEANITSLLQEKAWSIK